MHDAKTALSDEQSAPVPDDPHRAVADTGLLADAPRPTRSERLLNQTKQAGDERAGADEPSLTVHEESAEPTPFGAEAEKEH